jgi:pimeloyl-ACP methyl ester carboxylesterase
MERKLSRDVIIHYEEFGEGRPLFVLHGWGLDHHHLVWELEPNFVGRKGWRRIYPDLPGFGKTQGMKWIENQDDILDIVLEFIEGLAPGERFTIGGHSYGAYLARGVLVKNGRMVDGVFLNAPPIPWGADKQFVPTQTVVKEDPDFLAALTPDEQDWRNLFVTRSIKVLSDFRNMSSELINGNDPEFVRRLWESDSFSFEPDLTNQTHDAPTLIITGRQDSWVGYYDAFSLVKNFSRATYVVLDGAGHAVAYEHKLLHRALVSEWLDRVEDYTKSRVEK